MVYRCVVRLVRVGKASVSLARGELGRFYCTRGFRTVRQARARAGRATVPRARVLFPFQLTTNQELMPTRGIRLFN